VGNVLPIAEDLLASQEGLCSMELVGWFRLSEANDQTVNVKYKHVHIDIESSVMSYVVIPL
jgi:hypothetical protein